MLEVIKTAQEGLVKRAAMEAANLAYEVSQPWGVFGYAETCKQAKKKYNRAKNLLRDFKAASDNPMLQLALSEGHKKGLPVNRSDREEIARGAGLALGKKYQERPKDAVIKSTLKFMQKTKKEIQAKEIAEALNIPRITAFQALNYLNRIGKVNKRKFQNGIYGWKTI